MQNLTMLLLQLNEMDKVFYLLLKSESKTLEKIKDRYLHDRKLIHFYMSGHNLKLSTVDFNDKLNEYMANLEDEIKWNIEYEYKEYKETKHEINTIL